MREKPFIFILLLLPGIALAQFPDAVKPVSEIEKKAEYGIRLGLSTLKSGQVYLQTYKAGDPNIFVAFTFPSYLSGDHEAPPRTFCYIPYIRDAIGTQGYGFLFGKSILPEKSIGKNAYWNLMFQYSYRWGWIEYGEPCNEPNFHHPELDKSEVVRHSLGTMVYREKYNPSRRGNFYWGFGFGLHVSDKTPLGLTPESKGGRESTLYLKLDFGTRIPALFQYKAQGKNIFTSKAL